MLKLSFTATIGSILVSILLLLSIISSCNRGQKEREQREERIAAFNDSLAAFAQKHNAILDWKVDLSEMGRILTYNLEKIWLTPQPIVFEGGVSDIETYDNENYKILVYQNACSYSHEPIVYANFEMVLLCPKELINNRITQLSKDLAYFVDSVGVFIARIEKIQRTEGDEDQIDLFTGIGECVDIKLVECPY